MLIIFDRKPEIVSVMIELITATTITTSTTTTMSTNAMIEEIAERGRISITISIFRIGKIEMKIVFYLISPIF